jgi:hydrogenase nickel incorporation protein HypA/HybF
MHELAIAQSTLNHVRREAERSGARRVVHIGLRIGALSGVDPDSLRTALESLLPTSIADGATLELEPVPVRARCRDCHHEFTPIPGAYFECPSCNALGVEVLRGRELDLVRVDCA